MMNIRKSFISAIVTAIMLVTATCFAQIPVSELNIGGVYIGQPVSEVLKRFGEPAEKGPSNTGEAYFWYVSGSKKYKLIVQSSGDRSGHVVVASAGIGSDLLTKAGIGAGASLASIKAIYGEPDEISPHKFMKRVKYLAGDYQMSFYLNKDTETVETMGFSPNDFSSYSKPQTQKQPSQSQPTKPTGTIPKSVQEMPESEFYIGGITMGQTFDYVEQIYGKPSKIENEGFFQTYNYNDRFLVKGKLNNGYKVCSVAIYEKGLATPSGFTGETPYEVVVKKYGAGHEIKFKGEGVEAKLKGCKDVTYFCNNKQMVFLVDKKSVIKAIRVEERDDQKFIEAKRKK
jgi:hypothetical protein